MNGMCMDVSQGLEWNWTGDDSAFYRDLLEGDPTRWLVAVLDGQTWCDHVGSPFCTFHEAGYSAISISRELVRRGIESLRQQCLWTTSCSIST